MAKRRYQERGVIRREALLQALESLLTEREISALNYREIADLAGIPLPSCYNLFASKLDLIQALAESYAPRFNSFTFAPLDSQGSVASWQDLTSLWVDRAIDFMDRNPATRRLWFGGDVPARVTTSSRVRERKTAGQYRAFVDSYFELPDQDHLDDVFYLALEICDRFMQVAALSESQPLDFYVQEAKRAQNAYLSLYLPPLLPRRETEPEPVTAS